LARWLATTRRLGQGLPLQSLDYREPRGEHGLRDALADHLGRTRGVIVDPDSLLVTQGRHRALISCCGSCA
jgi:GntR family transcriptional regulator/MocR family aminotransferase